MGVKDSRSYVVAYTVAALCWMWCAVCLAGTVLVLCLDSGTSGRPFGLLDAGKFLLIAAAPVAAVGWLMVRFCWRAVHARCPAGFEVSPTSSPVIPRHVAEPEDVDQHTGKEVV